MNQSGDEMKVENVDKGTDRRDMMALKVESMCDWEQFLMPAPTSIAILGQLIAISTKQDFELNKRKPEGGFKFIKYPDSFRACLIQICNISSDAFMEAHRSMNSIHLQISIFQSSMDNVVRYLTEGTEEEQKKNLPELLKHIKGKADDCLKCAESTEQKFHQVLLVVDETVEVSAAVKGVYEKDLSDARAKKESLELQEKHINNRKQEMDKEKTRVIDELSKAKTALEKSIDQVPGIGTMLAMTSFEEGIKMATGGINLYAQYKMLEVSKGLSVVTSFSNWNSQKTPQASNQQQNISMKDDQHQQELQVAYQHATQIHACIEKMYKMFSESDGKNMFDLKKYENTLHEIKDALTPFKDELEKSEFAQKKTVVQTIKTCVAGIELCEEMLQVKKKNADELFQKVNKLKADSKGLQLKARYFFHSSPVSIPILPRGDKDPESKRAFEIASENARYEVEIRRKELDDAKRAREQLRDEFRQMEEKQNSILEGLSKTNIDAINFEEIQKTLMEGLIALSQLKKQWSSLVLFFQNIACRIDICLKQESYQIASQLEVSNYRVGNVTASIVLEMAASASCIAYAVQLISNAYRKISKNHLIWDSASLSELIAFNPKTDNKELEEHRKKVDANCKTAKAEISALAKTSREAMDRKIQSMYESLEKQLKNLKPLSEAKVKEIEENVKQISISEEQ